MGCNNLVTKYLNCFYEEYFWRKGRLKGEEKGYSLQQWVVRRLWLEFEWMEKVGEYCWEGEEWD